MAKDDIIFVKQGPTIISKGRVLGAYQFDSQFRIIDPNGVPWPHQVPVEWATDFPEISIKLGAEMSTVLLLSPKRVQVLQSAIDREIASTDAIAFLEGEMFRKEAAFRSRNRALIQAKKANCDFRCEVCGFKFEDAYGDIGRKYIVAHHNELLANGPAKSTLNDISLICANCHAMVHTRNPPLTIKELREIVGKHQGRRTS
jgi:predicted HNH restriction endonuclease